MPEITQKLGFDASGANSSLGNLATKLDTATTSLANFQNQARKTGVSGVDKTLDKAKKKTKEFTLSWKTMTRLIATRVAFKAFSVLVSTLKEGVEAARELGLAIEEIQTIAGGKLPESAAITQDVIALSDALGKSSQDLAEAFYQTISNQVVDVGEALNFTSQAAKLATVTVSETKDAVNALSSVMNSYGFEASKAEHVADTLFKTVELGRLRLSEIANVIGRVTPLTAAMGVEWEEAAAAIAVMTRQGVRADTAITQLRAIMTKIIRPTKEMRDIFHKWGVEDGKQAVQTFGGLVGVLKKLAVETGGSSSEMADLLRRVRTIVGQLSLMNDGGKALTETMEEIKNSTGEVSSKWDEFTQSDAFRLTQEMNRFENITTRLGLTAMPTLGAALGHVNTLLSEFSLGWKIVTGQMTASAKQADIIRVRMQALAEQQAEGAKEFSELQDKQYAGLTEAASKYYVEAQKEEFRLSAIRDNAIERATAKTKLQGKAILSFYKNSVKSLEKFIGDANSKIQSNAEKVADIQKDIDSRVRDSQLKGITGNFKKMAFLARELASQQAKVQKTFAGIGATEESRDRALAEGEVALKLAEQGKSIAEQSKNKRQVAQWDERIVEILENQQRVYTRHTDQIAKTAKGAKKLFAQQKRSELELTALTKQKNDLIASGALKADDAIRKGAALSALEEIDARIEEIFADTARGDAFLKSIGIENFKKITDSLSFALSQSRKDWSIEVAAAKAAFAREIIPIRIAIDPGGVKAGAAEALGLERIEGEGDIAFDRRIGEQSVEIAKEYDQLLESIKDKDEQIAVGLGETNDLMREGVAESMRRFENLKASAAITTRFIELGKLSTVTQEEYNATLDRAVQKQMGFGLALERSLQAQLTGAIQGKAATEADIALLKQQLELAIQTGDITASQAENYRAVIEALDGTKGLVQELNTLQEKLPEKEKLQAAKQVLGTLEQQRTSLEGQQGAQEKSAKAADTMTKRIDNGRSAMNKLKVSTDGAKTSVNDTASATAKLGPAAAGQIGQVNALAMAYRRMEVAALAAARAQAGAGGSATAYHGGPMRRYFADGGPVTRGQDKISTTLAKGETVVNSKQSQRFFSELNAMNQGSQPVFREQGGTVTNVGDVNVTVNGGDSSQQTVREIGHALRRQVQRGNIKLH
jgi:TP901 family phage tail tape measure protein